MVCPLSRRTTTSSPFCAVPLRSIALAAVSPATRSNATARRRTARKSSCAWTTGKPSRWCKAAGRTSPPASACRSSPDAEAHVSSTPSLMRKRLLPMALLLVALGAHAEPHGESHGGFGGAPHAAMERHDFHGPERHESHEPFRTEHLTFDDRFHHDHFYPALAYGIATLPYGNV